MTSSAEVRGVVGLRHLRGASRSLAERTTARIGGSARWLLEPRDAAECVELVDAVRAHGARLYVLGGGTNVLPPDGELGGAVIATQGLQGVSWEGDRVRAGAGVAVSKLIRGAAERGLAGLEVMTGVPGTVGGAVFGNSGTRYGAIGEVLSRVRVLDEQGRVRWIDRQAVAPRYRCTRLGAMVVLEVELGLTPGDASVIRRRIDEMQTHRKATQPWGAGSLGCFFKNPDEGSAGALIDRCGLKGRRVGGAMVSERHANFLLNVDNATAHDIVTLAIEVRDTVCERTGIVLEPEVRTWGDRRFGEAR